MPAKTLSCATFSNYGAGKQKPQLSSRAFRGFAWKCFETQKECHDSVYLSLSRRTSRDRRTNEAEIFQPEPRDEIIKLIRARPWWKQRSHLAESALKMRARLKIDVPGKRDFSIGPGPRKNNQANFGVKSMGFRFEGLLGMDFAGAL